ncbi:MAG: acyl-CoA dehydrogenase family protein [Nocardioides sp.]|nr:acyl-CoA dehydrogenase family protein [Nocardioides sp.]
MSDADLEELVERVFSEKAGHAAAIEAERTSLLTELWETVAELGLPWIGVDEEAGGSGGELADVVTLLRASGRHAVPLPWLENHLATWAFTLSGGRLEPDGPWTIAPGTPQDTLTLDGDVATGDLFDVAWGASASRVVALVEAGSATRLVVLDPSQAEVSEGRDLAGQPRDVLSVHEAHAHVLDSAVTVEQLRRRGAVLRAAQMDGAMQAVYDITKKYTAERQQFGRPIGTFQAVRSHIVTLAQMAVMTRLCVDRAAAALAAGEEGSFAAYATKLLADQNAALSIKSGHQAHGAIGMTREYALQDHTRRLNAWRGDWGTERALAGRIGSAVADAGRIATVATDAGSLAV